MAMELGGRLGKATGPESDCRKFFTSSIFVQPETLSGLSRLPDDVAYLTGRE
jgi:hypothetical protein